MTCQSLVKLLTYDLLIILNKTACILCYLKRALLISNIPHRSTFGSAVFALFKFKAALNLHYIHKLLHRKHATLKVGMTSVQL